jgi:flagellin-like protein
MRHERQGAVVFGADRGQSEVLGEVLLVGVAVVVAAVLSLGALGFGEDVRDPAPVVAESSGDLRAFDGGTDNQRVRIYHEAGDPVRSENVEIAVDARAACGKAGRIVDLPTKTLSPENLRGDTVMFDQSGDGFEGALETEQFTAGDRIEFRLKKEDGNGCVLDPGDRITVRVVHTPSGAVLIEERLTATGE